MGNDVLNQSRQPTPGERLLCGQTCLSVCLLVGSRTSLAGLSEPDRYPVTMCMVAYIASSSPLPLIPWQQDAPAFNVTS
jgi:hypothetical protein